METYSEFALQILETHDLKTKLAAPKQLLDDQRGESHFPLLPHRPKELRPDGRRIPFPSLKDIASDQVRATMLHSFANHELQAIELLAMALLRFPKAEKSFRKRLLETLKDEQTHCQLYIDRIREWGINFGDLPVGRNFLEQAPSLDTPLKFMAVFSLTFESSNLDFSLQFSDLFKKIGDMDSRKILLRVYADEVRHVRHGMECLRQFKEKGQEDWEAYLGALHFPVTPSRAKGPVFHRKAREAAGYSPDFIQALQSYAGRGPSRNIWVMNTGFEQELVSGTSVSTGVTSDLDYLFHLMAAAEDSVLANTDRIYLEKIKSLGFSAGQTKTLTEAKGLARQCLVRPMGWTQGVSNRLQLPDTYPHPSYDVICKWNSKTHAAHFCMEKGIPLPETCVARSAGDVEAWIKGRTTDEAWVLKSAQGVAGRGCFWGQGSCLSEAGQHFVKKHLAEGLVCQLWLERSLDGSVQGEVLANGKIRLLGFQELWNTPRGQVKALVTGCLSKRMQQKLESVAGCVGEALFREGYSGPFGVDAMMDTEGKIYPLLEINCRYTLGHIAWKVSRVLQKKACACLVFYHGLKISQETYLSIAPEFICLSPRDRFPGHALFWFEASTPTGLTERLTALDLKLSPANT